MKKLLIVLGVICSLSITSCKKDTNSVINVISPEEMETFLELDNVQLIDVRTPEEYKTGFIANAQNIDYYSPTFDVEINKLDKEKPIFVYCASGGRSASCSKKLKDAGFIKIYDLDGGITKWKHKGNEIKMNN
ncbi:rhodanese-like domain-containing protein [Yeosuana sp.]|uniref:rhodanese-like domain-containing protein n=1 Tax=Yeosuana sp. TaxID=2529388 RepID=UPI004055212C|tara:strand:+ start:2656 stop:3054 length:399 start_codon:yes stop_codon:yes gene_type:complete